ncbi:metalloprotease TldD [Candidatus Berkiella aquae]|uniref:Protease TldD n=1 Tax=Candidatus Berkiella aquae TaxID=295108 RepID=A0A0Q9YX32_9GAMM|nr:metalloprotease TldD [Candidatus Berkiella aquae]MCS5710715.1 metalloprotease TldD [Candidatus Berkiella aquae]
MNAIELARAQLLTSSGLSESDLERALGQLLGHRIDSGDLYFQSVRQESFMLEDGIVKEGSFNLDQGVGVRAISGEKTGFAYSDDIILPALEQAVEAARCIAASGKQQAIQAWERKRIITPLYTSVNPLEELATENKIALLREIDSYARKCDPRVSQVIVSLSGVFETILIVGSDGTFQADVRPLVQLNVTVIAQSKDRRETGSSGGGGRTTYAYFTENERAFGYAKEAVRKALVNLDAIEAPAGAMTVVLGPGWPGVLLHEAVGHGLEGDFNRKGSSTFSGRIGERVASPLCTIVDDGTLLERRGSLTVDDEGTPTQRTVLIENGILKGYLQDKLNAKLMGVASTGNGRRQSYSHIPMPRMTNTFMLPGTHVPEEIIASVEKGLYAVNFGGGSVDITSGKFVFSANEAYLIENGKVTRPVKGATLIGNGPDVMQKIVMVGNDLALDEGIGVCGKEGQSVPVGVGQPTLRIDDLTVGGTKN